MSGGGAMYPVDIDRRVVELAGGRTIALRLHVSFLTSLFQRIGKHIRDLRRGAIEADADHVALARFAGVCPR